MNDTISRQAAINVIASMEAVGYSPYVTVGRLDALLALNRLPSAERRGRWLDVKGYEGLLYRCSECEDKHYKHTTIKYDYCPYCGAKMMHENEEMSKVSETEMAYAEYLND